MLTSVSFIICLVSSSQNSLNSETFYNFFKYPPTPFLTMGRKVRALQFPLEPLKGTGIVNPLLSHWALLIGANDLLLEIFPVKGPSKALPRNEVRSSNPPNLEGRTYKLKFGIFKRSDTEKSNEEIIEAAQGVIRKHPYYNLAFYNCQDFVNNLADAITPVSVGRFVRHFVPRSFGRWLERGEESEDLPAVNLEQEAEAELGYLISLRDDIQRVGDVATWSVDESDLPAPEPDHQSLKPFSLRPQEYIQSEEEDSLVASGYGIIYDLVDNPQYVLANVPVPTNPRSLTDEQRERLRIATAQVGEHKLETKAC
ncbi:uncharacterized protein BDV17DRAFT_252105 [Aspergillus undulatus]|uniref:uncharacterized protein n=1 Tax=Aspergillus undulatus TaxID=1810928 RepID=UPI003CCC9782